MHTSIDHMKDGSAFKVLGFLIPAGGDSCGSKRNPAVWKSMGKQTWTLSICDLSEHVLGNFMGSIIVSGHKGWNMEAVL